METTESTSVMSVASPKWRALKHITLASMHVYLRAAKQYLYFLSPVSLGTLCRLCYGMEIATYILFTPIHDVSWRSIAIVTSLQLRVSLYEKGSEYRSCKQATCACEFRQIFLTRLFQTRQQ